MMNSQVVQYQEHLFVGILYQSFTKFDKGLRVHCLFVDHEANLALIGNRRNQVDPIPFGIKPYSRRFSPWSIAPTMLAVAAQPSLITPMDFSLFLLGFFNNGWIIFIKPFLNQFGVLFIGFTQRLLGGKSPAAKILHPRYESAYRWRKAV